MRDAVSSRPVSPLNIGLRLFVRTSAVSRKAKEMTANPNIAVCIGNFYFTGKAKPLGSVYDGGNAQIKRAYIARYPDSFGKEDEFIQSDEVFFELTIENVSEWVFAGGNPTGFAYQTAAEIALCPFDRNQSELAQSRGEAEPFYGGIRCTKGC